MTPFAGVGVNVGMQDSLELARKIIALKSGWDSSAPRFTDRAGLTAAIKKYETAMFARAEENAKASWMYLGIFFSDRGAITMVEHFEKIKMQERAVGAAATAEAREEVKKIVQENIKEDAIETVEEALKAAA